jgi:hypothetical protein
MHTNLSKGGTQVVSQRQSLAERDITLRLKIFVSLLTVATETLQHSTTSALSLMIQIPLPMNMSVSHNIVRLGIMSESFTGPPARRLIEQVGLIQMDKGPLIVLDNVCGTASLLYEMLDENAKENLQFSCGEFSEAMVQSVQQRIVEREWLKPESWMLRYESVLKTGS